jgi:hypothetical protein
MGQESELSELDVHTQLLEAKSEHEALISQRIVLGDHDTGVREALHDAIWAQAWREQILKLRTALRLIAIVSSVASETHLEEVVGKQRIVDGIEEGRYEGFHVHVECRIDQHDAIRLAVVALDAHGREAG